MLSQLEIRQKISVDATEPTSIAPYLKGCTFKQGTVTSLVQQPLLLLLEELHLILLILQLLSLKTPAAAYIIAKY